MINNKVNLIGRLTKQPQITYTPKGTPKCEFTLAVQLPKSQRTEEKNADFIFCTAFGKRAEMITEYVNKGEQLAVEGKLSASHYTKNGETRFSLKVYVNEFFLLSSKKRANEEIPLTDEELEQLSDSEDSEFSDEYVNEDGVVL